MKITLKKSLATILVIVMFVTSMPMEAFAEFELPAFLSALLNEEETSATADKEELSEEVSDSYEEPVTGDEEETVPDDAEENNVTWSFDETTGELRISGKGEMENHELDDIETFYSIPWFSHYKDIDSIVVEEGITSIGDFAFAYLYNAETISLPSTLRSIGAYAFAGMMSLNELIIPEGVTTIGEGILVYASQLNKLVIPSTVTSFEDDESYIPCAPLTELVNYSKDVAMPEYLIGIFFEDYEIQKIYSIYYSASLIFGIEEELSGMLYDENAIFELINERLVRKGYEPFADMASVQKFINDVESQYSTCFPDWYKVYCYEDSLQHEYALESHVKHYIIDGSSEQCICYPLRGTSDGVTWNIDPETRTITFGGTGTITDENAWKNLNRLYDTVKFESGSNITAIDFDELGQINKIEISATVSEIDFGDIRTPEITIDPANEYYCVKNNFVLSKDEIGLYRYSGSEEKVEIPSTVVGIWSEAFRYCKSLKEVIIPSSVQVMGELVFVNCDNLEKVEFEENSQLEYIDLNAFVYCGKLEKITIPTSVTDICSSSLEGCNSLENINVERGNLYYSSENGVLYNTDKTEIIKYPAGKQETQFTIPASVASIEDHAFHYCSNLEKVEFEENSQLTSIGSYIFEYCSSLKEITIPASVTSIGNYAFGDCYSLEKFTVLNSLCNVSSGVFGYNNPPANLTIYGYLYSSVHQLATSKNINFESLGETVPSQPSDFTYSELSDGTISITGYNGSSANVVIPEEIDGKTVTSIGKRSFEYNDNILRVVIPSGVKIIDEYAFYDCDKIGIVEFAENSSLETIGDESFASCEKLTEITIPASVKTISADAFYYSQNLRKVEFESGSRLETIGQYAFRNCSQLQEIIIPSGVTSIGSYAFSDCYNLKNVVLPDNSSFTEIADHTFYNCEFSAITIPESVTSIGAYAFGDNSNLTVITIPADVANIGESAFGNCTKLSSIEVSADNTSYQSVDGVLYNADKTTLMQYPAAKSDKTFAVPASVTSIDGYAFRGAKYVESITFAENCSIKTINGYTFSNCNSLKEITIPESVTSIGSYAFAYCYNLEKVEFEENSQLTTIEYDAFYDCDSLKEITIPESVTSIGSSAFQSCSALKEITIPEGVTSIGSYVFAYCYSLEKLTVLNSACNINSSVFGYNNPPDNLTIYSYTGSLVHLFAQNNNIPFESIGELPPSLPSDYTYSELSDGTISITGYTGISFNAVIPEEIDGKTVTAIGEYVFQNKTITKATVPATVTSIGRYAFANCNYLSEITFAENSQLTTICDYAFYYCYALKEIIIPESVTSIGSYAFYNCSNLEKVEFAENSQLTTIGSYAFRSCYALKEITIPASVTRIESGAFYYNNLEKVEFAENSQLATINSDVFYSCDSLKEITIPASVTSIGSNAFYSCSNLEKVEFAENSQLTTINSYAFRSCFALKEITIPASVTRIESCAFYSCSNLEKVEFAENSQLTTIGSEAFYCSKIKEITIPASVTNIGSYAFSSCSGLQNITILNPSCSINSYMLSSGYPAGLIISGHSESTAKTFAANKNLSFVTVCEDFKVDNNEGVCGDRYYIVTRCSVCNYEFNRVATDEILEHTMSEWITGTDATCTEDGYKYRYCLNCDYGRIRKITLPAETYPESPHNYFNNMNETYNFSYAGAEKLYLTFSSNTRFQSTLDYLYIYNSAGARIGEYSGTELAGKTIEIEGNSFSLRFETSSSTVYYGFSFSKIEADVFGNPELDEDYYVVIPATGHSWSEWQTIDATCTQDGYNYQYCLNCDMKPFIRTLPAETYPESPHNYTNNMNETYNFSYAGAEKLYLTFSTSTKFHSSLDCLYIYNSAGAQIGKYSGTELAGKTIEIEGNSFLLRHETKSSTVYYGFSFSKIEAVNIDSEHYERISATGHSLSEWQTIDATCTKNGFKYRYCLTCNFGRLFTLPAETYPESPHDYLNNMYKTYKFSYAGAKKLYLTFSSDTMFESGYDYLYIYNSEGTLIDKYSGTTLAGKTIEIEGSSFSLKISTGKSNVYYGFSFSNIAAEMPGMSELGAEYYEVIPATGHLFGDWTTATAATCTNTGREIHRCTNCSFSESKNVEALGHDFSSEWTIDKEPTCTGTGSKSYHCLRCTAKDSTSVIEALGHDFSSEWTIDKEPTCTETGSKSYHCSRCTVKDSVTVIDAFGHSWSEWQTVEPTCEEDGCNYKYCLNCNSGRLERITLPAESYPESPHSYTNNMDEIYNFAYAGAEKLYLTFSTDTKFESVDYLYIYNSAGAQIGKYSGTTLAGETIEIEGNSFSLRLTTDRSIVYYGFSFSKIEAGVIGSPEPDSDYYEVVPATGHDYEVTTTDPTCTQKGTQTSVCNNCSDTIVVKIDPLGHDFATDWTIDKEPDCVETGSKSKHCSRCDVRSEVTIIDALGHDYESTRVPATESMEEHTYYKCTRCDSDYILFDPASPVSGLIVIEDTYSLSLSWLKAVEATVTGYNVYRKSADEEIFSVITTINSRNTVSYIDQDVITGVEYQYYITALKGNVEGVACESVSGVPRPDTEAPRVLKADAAKVVEGRISGNVSFSLKAEDNIGVVKYAFYYSPENSEEWVLIEEKSGASVTISFNTKNITDGIYRFRTVAYDESGNFSNGFINEYIVDNTGPEKVMGLNAKAIYAARATIEWSKVADSDLHHFILKKKTKNGYSVISESVSSLGYNLTGLTPETRYTYIVAGVDKCGNIGEFSDEFTFETTADTIAPVITRVSPAPARYNKKINFSVTAEDDYNIQKIVIISSADLNEWAVVTEKEFSGISSQRNQTFAVSLDSFAEGNLFLAAVAYDNAENSSPYGEDVAFVQYIVDRTVSAPVAISAVGAESYINILWNPSNDTDIKYFNVYRSIQGSNAFECIADNLITKNYIDKTAASDVTYDYAIVAVDEAGNISAYSNIVSGKMREDETAPSIVVSPTDGTLISNSYKTIVVTAKDNYMLSEIVVEYKVGTTGEWMQLMSEKDINASTKRINVIIPTSDLEDASVIYLRASCIDAAGRESVYVTNSYVFDSSAPKISDSDFKLDEDKITISWNDKGESDLYAFVIYCSKDEKNYQPIKTLKPESDNKYSYSIDMSSWSEGKYQFKIESIDALDNRNSIESAVFDFTKVKKNLEPIAEILGYDEMEVSVQEYFDASESIDSDGEIIAYEWDFGDGTKSDKIKPVKKYEKEGTYTVKLTVTDNEGLSGVAEKTVIVKSREQFGLIDVTVVDTKGNSVSGVSVKVDGNDSFKRVTNSDGSAKFKVPVGEHFVSAYLNQKYLPVMKTISVLSNTTTYVTLTVVEGTTVDGEITVSRLSFDEIQALKEKGFDVGDEANSQFYKSSVDLSYDDYPITLDIYRDENGGIIDWSYTPIIPDVDPDPPVPGPEPDPSLPDPEPPYIPEDIYSWKDKDGNEYIGVMSIGAETKFLKEIFKVRLDIFCNASSEFEIVDSIVTLNIPEGLSIVSGIDGYVNDSIAQISSIPGGSGSTTTIEWIIRGDAEGEYDLSADFIGMIMPINEVVRAEFNTNEPIKVYGKSIVKTIYNVAESFHRGRFYFNLGIENVSDTDVYYPDISFSEETIATFGKIYNESVNNSEFNPDDVKVYQKGFLFIDSDGTVSDVEEMPTVLKPGQAIYRKYIAEGFEKYINVTYFNKAVVNDYGSSENVNVSTAFYPYNSEIFKHEIIRVIIRNETFSETFDSTYRFYPNETAQFAMTALWDNGIVEDYFNPETKWYSSDSDVASVNSSGLVTAKTDGVTHIYAVIPSGLESLTFDFEVSSGEPVTEITKVAGESKNYYGAKILENSPEGLVQKAATDLYDAMVAYYSKLKKETIDIEKYAEDLKKEDLADDSKYINMVGLNVPEKALDAAYYAFAVILTESADSKLNFSNIDTDNPLPIISWNFANTVLNAIKGHNGREIEYGGYTVQISGLSVDKAITATIKVISKKTGISYKGSITSKTEDVENILNEYVDHLSEIGKEEYKKVLLSLITEFTDVVNIGTREYFDIDLKEPLDKANEKLLKDKGFGKMTTILLNIHDSYQAIMDFMNLKNSKDLKEALKNADSIAENLKAIDFTGINTAGRLLKAELKAIESAKDKLVEELLKYSGKEVEDDSILAEFLDKAGDAILNFFGVKCPVEFTVTDKYGNVIGYVDSEKDDYVYYSDDIFIEVRGEEKYIYAPADMEININFHATGNGNMNYTIEQLSNGNAIGRLNYYDIPLVDGEKYVQAIPSNAELEDLKDSLILSGDEVQYLPDEYISGSDVFAHVKIECFASQGGVVYGKGEYPIGDSVVLLAFSEDGYQFDGWYADDVLISKSNYHKFIAKEDLSIHAKFSQKLTFVKNCIITLSNDYNQASIEFYLDNDEKSHLYINAPEDSFMTDFERIKIVGYDSNDQICLSEEFSTIFEGDCNYWIKGINLQGCDVVEIYDNSNVLIAVVDFSRNQSSECTKIGFDLNELYLDEQDEYELLYAIFPINVHTDVIFSSDNEEVAVVDENGLLSAISAGEANIKVQAANNASVYSICKVFVQQHIHDYGEWEVMNSATCNEPGQECRICKNNSTHVEYRDITDFAEHQDSDNDDYCDVCNINLTEWNKNCSHVCHSKNSIIKFLWRIIILLGRLFNNQNLRYCDCGTEHW